MAVYLFAYAERPPRIRPAALQPPGHLACGEMCNDVHKIAGIGLLKA